MKEPMRRKAVRALVLTPGGQVLLMRVEEPRTTFRVWITPGGGILDGENEVDCIRREIIEETGFCNFRVGPPIWTRRHTFDWAGQNVSQEETYYLVKTERFTPSMAGNPDEGEKKVFLKFRWWTANEIAASKDVLAPSLLSEHINKLITNGPPEEPFDCGI